MLVRWLNRISAISLYGVLVTPLLVWPDFIFPHLTSKVLAFQLFVEAALAATGISFLLTRVPKRWSGFKRLRRPLALAVSVLLGYSVFSAFAGVDVRRSFWGFLDRQDGLILWLHFLAWAGLLVGLLPWTPSEGGSVSDARVKSRLRDSSRWQSLEVYANASFWVSVAVAGTALAEWFYASFLGYLPRMLSAGVPGRVSGVLGNPVALGPYLLFHFFYGLYYFRSTLRPATASKGKSAEKQKRFHSDPEPLKFRPKSWIILAALVLFGWVIILGETRGVILALVLALFLGGLALLFGSGTPRWVKLGAIAVNAVLILAVALVYLLRDTAVIRNVSVLDRLTHISVAENQSTRMRLMTWHSAWDGFKDHPVSGWGHDNIYYALNRYYNPDHVLFIPPIFNESKQTWYDKSHNSFLDLLVEKGSIGAFLYGACGLAVLWTLSGIKDRFLALCLLTGFLAHAVSNFFAFDTFGSLFGLFLFLAISVSADERATRIASSVVTAGGAALERRPEKWRAFAAAALAVLLALGVYVNFSIASTNAGSLAAQRTFAAEPNRAIYIFREALGGFSPYSPRHKLDCAYSIVTSLAQGKHISDVEASVEWAMRLAREAIAAHPLDAAAYMFVTDMLNSLVLARDKKYSDEALIYGKRALELSPRRQEAIIYLGRAQILSEQTGKAVDLNRQMVWDVPAFAVGHWFLGLSLLADKQIEEGKQEIFKAFEMGFKVQNRPDLERIRGYFTPEEFDRLLK